MKVVHVQRLVTTSLLWFVSPSPYKSPKMMMMATPGVVEATSATTPARRGRGFLLGWNSLRRNSVSWWLGSGVGSNNNNNNMTVVPAFSNRWSCSRNRATTTTTRPLSIPSSSSVSRNDWKQRHQQTHPASTTTRSLFGVTRHTALAATSSSTTTTTTSLEEEDEMTLQRREQELTADCLEIVQQAIAQVNPQTAIFSHCRRRVLVEESSSPRQHNIQQENKQEETVASSNQVVTLHIGRETTESTDTSSYYNLLDYDDIVVVAFGKASSGMATALVQVLVGEQQEQEQDTNHQEEKQTTEPSLDATTTAKIADKISGLVICKDDHATREQVDYLARYNISVHEAAHPIPDHRSVQATLQLLNQIQPPPAQSSSSSSSSSPTSKRLVLVCISGGGSALLCAPQPPISLADLQTTNRILLESGWSIHEINVVRKHLELVKGGGLWTQATTASGDTNTTTRTTTTTDMVSLILSDVIGDPLDLIASGPTVPDTSTYQQAWTLVQQRLPQQGAELPSTVRQVLSEGVQREVQEQESSQEPDKDEVSESSHSRRTCLVGNNALAVETAAQTAKSMGYHPIVLGTQFQGEAQDMAKLLVSMAQHIQQGPANLIPYSLGHDTNKKPIALIAGGETTVTIPPNSTGRGGRNQELALTAALALRDERLASGLPVLRNIVVASVGTDGTDGPTDAAGAVVTGATTAHNGSSPLTAAQALRDHNSYDYFHNYNTVGQVNPNKSLSPLIRTGPTGTNVADLMVVLIDPLDHNQETQPDPDE